MTPVAVYAGERAERNEIDRTGNISQLLCIYVAFFRYFREEICVEKV